MKRRPYSVKQGAFTWPVIIDCLSYGTVMGATCLLNFVIVIYGVEDGQLARDCNHSASEACDAVFRARSTVFATLIFEILLYAIVLKSFERSIFALTPGQPFWVDWWANKVLFWSVVIGMVSVVLREFGFHLVYASDTYSMPAIYVPTFNTNVFYQKGISWEWGLVVGMTVVFILWSELWKVLRKHLYRRWEPAPVDEQPTA